MPSLSTTPEEIERLLRAGHSDLAVHRATGASRGTVARYRRRLGLPRYRVTADSPACRHGHPFPEHRAFYPNGWLYCLECSRTRGRNRASTYQPRGRVVVGQPRRRVRAYQPVQPDEIAIERAVAGDPPERLTPRERAAAVRALDRKGLSAAEIAERVRCSQRNVHYLRSTFRRAA